MKKKKQYVEEGIFSIYPDYPILINENIICTNKSKPLHFHYYLEIGYCFEGRSVFSSTTQSYQVGVGDITIAAANILHSMIAEKEVCSKWSVFYVDMEDLLLLFPIGDVRTQLQVVREYFQNIYCLKSEEHPDITWLIQEMLRLNREKKQNYKKQIIGLLYALLFKLYDVFYEAQQEYKDVGELSIMPAIQYIYDHYAEEIKVRELAKICHFSESYFRKVFMEMKGMSPKDYLNSIRIREAGRMLLNSTDTVRMIGEKCGYQTVTTFERNFKKRTGMLPTEWRECHKNPNRIDNKVHKIKRIFYMKE